MYSNVTLRERQCMISITPFPPSARVILRRGGKVVCGDFVGFVEVYFHKICKQNGCLYHLSHQTFVVIFCVRVYWVVTRGRVALHYCLVVVVVL